MSSAWASRRYTSPSASCVAGSARPLPAGEHRGFDLGPALLSGTERASSRAAERSARKAVHATALRQEEEDPVQRLRVWLPLVGFVVPSVGIGYGVVIPRSCIAGVNELTLGFASTVLGACVSYAVGVRMARSEALREARATAA